MVKDCLASLLRQIQTQRIMLAEKLLLLVDYVRRSAHYLDKLDAVDIIVRNNINWPKLIE